MKKHLTDFSSSLISFSLCLLAFPLQVFYLFLPLGAVTCADLSQPASVFMLHERDCSDKVLNVIGEGARTEPSLTK